MVFRMLRKPIVLEPEKAAKMLLAYTFLQYFIHTVKDVYKRQHTCSQFLIIRRRVFGLQINYIRSEQDKNARKINIKSKKN